MRRVKSLISADDSAKLILLGVWQKMLSRERGPIIRHKKLKWGLWQINNRGGVEIF